MEWGQVFTVGFLGVSIAFTAVLVGMTLYERILIKIDLVLQETKSQGRETERLREESQQLRWKSEQLRQETDKLRREAENLRREVLRLTRESGRASPVYALLPAHESGKGNRLSKYRTIP